MTQSESPLVRREFAIIGGGPAGLQAAATIARVHRDAVLFDSGEYRNAPARHMHNIAALDGMPPGEFRARALEQLAPYETVEIRTAAVNSVTPTEDGAYLVSADDGTQLVVNSVILATGVRDTLPEIPGIQRFWGEEVAHCPFCHGHEYAGRRVGLIGPAAPHLAQLMLPITDQLVALSNGEPVPDGWQSTLDRLGVATRHDPVREIEAAPDGIRLKLDAEPLEVAGLLVTPTFAQRAPFAEQLGLSLLASGCVEVDDFGATSRAGIFAAGDMAHRAAYPMPLASVVASMAAGQLAASGAIQAALATASSRPSTPAPAR